MSVVLLGSINMDVVLRTSTIAQPGETLSASDKNLYSGGKGANQAIASARMQVPTHLLGAVGDDHFGTILKTGLAAEGMSIADLQTLRDADTGQAYICVADNGENTVIVVPGANHAYRFAAAHMPTAAGQAVYLSQFEMPLSEIHAFLMAASDGLHILNAAPAVAEGKSLFELSEIIIVNETELAIFTGADIGETTLQPAIESAARTLIGRDDQWVIVTLGKKGVLAVSRSQVLTVPGHTMNVIDTTGAGDCFCGTLAAMLSENMDMQSALVHANAAAALAVTKAGAGPSMPHRQDVIRFVAENA